MKRLMALVLAFVMLMTLQLAFAETTITKTETGFGGDVSVTVTFDGDRIVAVEATGDEYARHYRCYGSLRLVTYAQFLLNHFFPRMQRLCQGEGVAMRSYAIGEAESALIEMQAAQAECFRKRFFGQLPPVLPSAAILEFENKWRAVQLDGPQTKGGTIEAPPVTLQI